MYLCLQANKSFVTAIIKDGIAIWQLYVCAKVRETWVGRSETFSDANPAALAEADNSKRRQMPIRWSVTHALHLIGASLHAWLHLPLCCSLLALWSSAIFYDLYLIPFGAWLFHSLYYLLGTSFIYYNDIHAHRETETEPWCGTLLWDIYAKIFCLCWINILIQEPSGWTSLVESLPSRETLLELCQVNVFFG